MNIAVLADIHANYSALKAVLADMDASHADAAVFLGDILFYGDEPMKCFETVKALNPLVWIKGNTDDWLSELDENFKPQSEIEERCFKEFMRVNPMLSPKARETVKSLPEKEEIVIEGKRILCVHGSDRRINEPIGIMTPKDELEALASRLGADILLCGHTHTPFSASAGGKLILNAGSVGKPADEPRACWCMLRFDGSYLRYEIRRVGY